ncbi:hypothetical protein [Amycolatopsis decaplanina]|nr:hypothetical protein [Amycolatopsis decaplanina]
MSDVDSVIGEVGLADHGLFVPRGEMSRLLNWLSHVMPLSCAVEA